MKDVPIPTLHLFHPLEQKLVHLLKSLTAGEWEYKTLAKRWRVKDVAAHLLDGQIRTLALTHDYVGDPPGQIQGYGDLVNYLNRLNADWVQAMKRVSPATLIELIEITQKPFIDYFHSLDPWGTARFAVSWAGEATSFNWFHTAREYTERWHHQQQIRVAVNKPGLMEKEFLTPLLQTFMMALPHSYRKLHPSTPAVVKIIIADSGTWCIHWKDSHWIFTSEDQQPDVTITLDADTAWRLFTKALTSDEAKQMATVTGQAEWAEPFFTMVSVMA